MILKEKFLKDFEQAFQDINSIDRKSFVKFIMNFDELRNIIDWRKVELEDDALELPFEIDVVEMISKSKNDIMQGGFKVEQVPIIGSDSK